MMKNWRRYLYGLLGGALAGVVLGFLVQSAGSS